MHRVHEREYQADRNRLHVLFAQSPAALAHRVFIQWLVDGAIGQDPSWNGQAPAPRSDLLWRGQANIPDILLEAAAILDLIAKPFRGDEAGQRAVHFYQSVVGDGGGVHDGIALPQELHHGQAQHLCQLFQPAHDTDGAVFRGAQILVKYDFGTVQKRKVSERATNIYSNTIAHRWLLTPLPSLAALSSGVATPGSPQRPPRGRIPRVCR